MDLGVSGTRTERSACSTEEILRVRMTGLTRSRLSLVIARNPRKDTASSYRNIS